MSNQKDHPGRIIVKNYPPDTSTRDLQIMFEKYGKIDDRELVINILLYSDLLHALCQCSLPRTERMINREGSLSFVTDE